MAKLKVKITDSKRGIELVQYTTSSESFIPREGDKITIGGKTRRVTQLELLITEQGVEQIEIEVY